MFRYIVLGMLRDGTPRHGYALMKEYRSRAGTEVGSGSFYRELQRLAAEDLVEAAANPPEADRRRAPYVITEKGVECFDRWVMAQPARIGEYYDNLFGRSIFLGTAAGPVVRELLSRWGEELWLRGKVLERAREHALINTCAVLPNQFPALPVLLSRRMKHVATDLEFLQKYREAYDAWETAHAAPPPEPRESAVRARKARGSR